MKLIYLSLLFIVLQTISCSENIQEILDEEKYQPDTIQMRKLLATGDINAKDEHGWTILMFASQMGNVKTVNRLIKKEVNVNAVNNKVRCDHTAELKCSQTFQSLCCFDKAGRLTVTGISGGRSGSQSSKFRSYQGFESQITYRISKKNIRVLLI